MVGSTQLYDDIFISGNPAELEFAVYFLRQGHITGIATLNRDPEAVAMMALIREKVPLCIGLVQSGGTLVQQLKEHVLKAIT